MAQRGAAHARARAIGERGEQLAVDHLRAHGVRIVERNWRCDLGEIDIVGIEGDTLVFYEVKTRRSTRFGTPVQAVTPAKAHRLRRLAGRWMSEHSHGATNIRVDVLGLTVSGRAVDIEHVRGAF
ncbi:MAG: YraN family protein [Ornithinimicrobium sp.]